MKTHIPQIKYSIGTKVWRAREFRSTEECKHCGSNTYGDNIREVRPDVITGYYISVRSEKDGIESSIKYRLEGEYHYDGEVLFQTKEEAERNIEPDDNIATNKAIHSPQIKYPVGTEVWMVWGEQIMETCAHCGQNYYDDNNARQRIVVGPKKVIGYNIDVSTNTKGEIKSSIDYYLDGSCGSYNEKDLFKTRELAEKKAKDWDTYGDSC